MLVEDAPELIGGNNDMQPIFQKEDRAGTVENDLISDANSKEKYYARRVQDTASERTA
jgi:hypothetical protein